MIVSLIISCSVWLAAAPPRLEVRLAPPTELAGSPLEVLVAIEQLGRVVSEWKWSVPAEAGQSLVLTRDLTEAAPVQATLHLCINRDAYRSHVPSVGDWYARVPLDPARPSPIDLSGQWRLRTLTSAENLLTVHYHRPEADYDAIGLWTWGESPCTTPAEQEVFAAGRDQFGLVFQIDLGDYACPRGPLGMLPRVGRTWDHKDGPDRLWSESHGRDVYILPNDAKIYSAMPDTSAKLQSAVLLSADEIRATFTHAVSAEPPSLPRFALFNEDGIEVRIAGVTAPPGADGQTRAFILRTAVPLPIEGHAYRVHAQQHGDVHLQLGALLADAQRYYADLPMGAICTPEKTTFRLFAPTARQVWLILSDSPVGPDGLKEHPMTMPSRGIWELELPGPSAGKFYSFRLNGPGYSGEACDPAAICASGLHARPALVNLRETDPPGFRPVKHPTLAAYTDAVIYEMSVRDFTVHPQSGIRHKGLYLGLTESGTHLEGHPKVRTGLDHLVELGVTHVQLMPVLDFDNEESDRTAYNWGYMPVLFNTPDGWFATSPIGSARITELKAAIAALHERGIGVILDVVYNHTSADAPLDKVVPGYYYRLTEAGQFSNGSGCGNEFDSEKPMAAKLMLDSLRYWVREYGVDGFRFDLMGLHAPETMLRVRDALREIHPDVLIYGEPWTAGATTLPVVTDKSHIRGTGIAAFNDHFRDAIKGDRDGGAPGFIQVGDRLDGVKKGIAGAIDDWALHPTDSLQYCEAHDNLTTWDKLTQSTGQQPEKIRERMQRFAGLIVLTSQGIPFIHSGQEFCRSKGGNHNSYNAPDEVNQIDWSLKARHAAVFDYYRGLIELRKSHPVLRLRTSEQVRSRLTFLPLPPESRCLAYTLDGAAIPQESFSVVLVLMNADAAEQTLSLPEGRWSVYADADRAGDRPLREVELRATLPAHSGMLLAR